MSRWPTKFADDAMHSRAGTGYIVPSVAQCALHSCAGGQCGLSPDRTLSSRVFNEAVAVLMLLTASAFAQEPAILRPANQTVLRPGPLTVVARGPASATLVLDGKAVASVQPAQGIFTAAINPPPGIHELTLGAAKVQFAVGMAQGAEGWKQFRAHPAAAQCTA